MQSLDRLIRALRRWPGVGPRQAERFAMHLLRAPQGEVEELQAAITGLKQGVTFCRICHAYSETDICPICADADRDHRLLCIVEDPQDIDSIEKTGVFRGVYHVLHGTISPMEGRGAEQIKVKELLARVQQSNPPIEEIILATDPDAEGETTALYLADLLRGQVERVSRIGYGVPLGGDIDYLDELTLGYSFKGRTKM